MHTTYYWQFRRFLVALLGILASAALAQAADNFEFSATTKIAYKAVLSLRFEDAKAATAQTHRTDHNNLAADYVDDYIDFFRIVIDEDKTLYSRLAANKDYRLGRIAQYGNPNSPYHNYMQAQIRLHWAIVKVRFEEYVGAAWEVKKAYALLEQNQRKFPDFIANKASLGVLHAAVGTIPDDYRWGANLVGMSGTIQQGQREVSEVLAFAKKNDFIFEEETIVLYAFLLLHLGNQGDDAWQTIRSPKLNAATSPLACFVQANIALHTAHSDEAIRLLINRPTGEAFYPFWFLEYMLGFAKLNKGDADARTYLTRYVRNFKGNSYIKDTYERLAWEALLRGDAAGYKTNMASCKTQGKTTTENDKKANSDAQNAAVPNVFLLRARLLFDGGYYSRAAALVAEYSEKDFATPAQKLEYWYRQGRIQDKLDNTAKAIIFYNQTIEKGKNDPAYFACNAALQLGLLYERQKNKPQAIIAYNLCLSLSPSEFKAGLHQKAKAGLNRLR